MIIALSVISAAILSALLTVALKPLLIRYALARPNARSSHKAPTPQGAGIAVLAAAIFVTGGAAVFLTLPLLEFLMIVGGAIIFALVGMADDIKPMPVRLRLAMQFTGVILLVGHPDSRLFPEPVPFILEWALIILGGVWFVNLVNFMDGLDWMTVSEIVPVTAFIAGLGLVDLLPMWIAVLAAALCGALLGFAPFNKPVARVFLGDVGSLSIGLLVGWMLLQLAGAGALVAAILLPLYYLMDATITLFRRLARRERIWEAHRSHFYQRATDNGFSVMAVVTHVFMLNLALAALAAMTLVWPSSVVQVAALAAGLLLVGLVLRRFSHPRVMAPVEVSR
ncbi:MraY family glycosyltransferase [Microvirga sp. G4-2]|uniref:MraY family glycosyltransferase n=1 Tax=Microvirga sp. G4-2 TaxID=3434467 RepID=UPI004044FA74